MHFYPLVSTIVGLNAIAAFATSGTDFAAPCYSVPLPSLPADTSNRTIPWGKESLILPNGTTCCDSLTQIRAGIDELDSQLLSLLALRAGYVREAARFKSTVDSLNVPSRNAAVIQEAIDDAHTTTPPTPASIAKEVFSAIINSSVPFEECVFTEFLAHKAAA